MDFRRIRHILGMADEGREISMAATAFWTAAPGAGYRSITMSSSPFKQVKTMAPETAGPESPRKILLRKTFRIVQHLLGSGESAEAVVLEAIDASDPEDTSADNFLREAIRIALASEAAGPAAQPGLPPELIRVQNLPATLRHCFVLRVLAGLSQAESAQLLNLSVAMVNERTCEAARRLAA
jgi:hypothetical protein